jgi:hypothetical protein
MQCICHGLLRSVVQYNVHTGAFVAWVVLGTGGGQCIE